MIVLLPDLGQLERTMASMFLHSSGTPLHFVIVTDRKSLESAGEALGNIVSKELAMQVIVDMHWAWRRKKGLAAIRFSFVNIDDIIEINGEFIAALKRHKVIGDDVVTKDKYAADLFYVAPLYHLAFLGMDKIIFIDSSDLIFATDVKDLQELFENIGDEAVMSIGLDLSPHYRINLNDYIQSHPSTHLGQPGPCQGLNTGVVLYDLDKMRQSITYNSYLTTPMVDALFKTYNMSITVGDQDFFTLLSFHSNNLISILPCQFNTQTSMQYWAANKESFHSFHFCDVPSSIKIFHGNGCGPHPEQCDSPKAPLAEYREYVNIFIQVVTINNFWKFLARVSQAENSLDLIINDLIDLFFSIK